MKNRISLKKLGVVLVSAGAAGLVISTIVILSSLWSIYGMAGDCKNSNGCDTRLDTVSTTVHIAKFAMYASTILVAGGVFSLILNDTHKKPQR